MKKLVFILLALFLVVQVRAQTPEYIQQKDFQAEKKKINEAINASKKQLNEIKKADARFVQSFDSLKRTIIAHEIQLSLTTDSLTKTSAELTAIREKVNSQNIPSRGARILVFAILFILFAILFILVFLFKKRAYHEHQSLVELSNKTNERLDAELKSLKTELQNCRALIDDHSREMNQRLKTGMDAFESRINQLDQQLQENIAGMKRTIEPIGPEIGKLKGEQSSGMKAMEERLNALQGEVAQKSLVLASRVVKLEEEVQESRGKH